MLITINATPYMNISFVWRVRSLLEPKRRLFSGFKEEFFYTDIMCNL